MEQEGVRVRGRHRHLAYRINVSKNVDGQKANETGYQNGPPQTSARPGTSEIRSSMATKQMSSTELSMNAAICKGT